MSNQAPDGIYETYRHLLSRLGKDVLPPREQFDAQMAQKLETWFSSDEGCTFEAWSTGKQDDLSPDDLDRIRQTLKKLCSKAPPKQPKAKPKGDYDLGLIKLPSTKPKPPVAPSATPLDKDYKRFELLFSSLDGQQDETSTSTLIPIFKLENENAGQGKRILPKRSNFTADDAKRINEWLAGPNGKAFQEWVSGTRPSLSRPEFDAINSDLAMLQARQRPLPFYLSDFKQPDYLTFLDKSPDPLGDMIKPKGSAPKFLPESALDDGMQLLRPRQLLRDIVPKTSIAPSSDVKGTPPKPKSTTTSQSKPSKESSINQEAKTKIETAFTWELPEPEKPSIPPNMPPSYKALHDMIGLESVKQAIMTRAYTFKGNRERERQGGKALSTSMHMVFTGNPGTGKTETAKIVGEIYRDLGLLSKGTFTSTTPADLIVGYIRQTGENTRKKIEEAVGGVLFIDEAYGLVKKDDSGRDFGPEAVEELLVGMEGYRNDLVVILAGYAKEMQGLIKSNPGFESRVRTFIEFPDYKPTELQAIFMKMCQDGKLKLDSRAKKKLGTTVKAMYDRRGETFGNGREVRNLLDLCIERQSNRLYGSGEQYDEAEIWVLSEDDIPDAAELK